MQGLVARADPDRHLTALFAPACKRDILFALYAFNHELARAREVAGEPAMALIRLQWWREVIEGAARPHEVAVPIRQALDAGALSAVDLLAMIEARERDIEAAPASMEDWRATLLLGPGSLAVAAGRLLGAPASALDRLRQLGAGYGAAGALRSIAWLARAGRCQLPADLLTAHGLDERSVIDDPASRKLLPLREALAAEGRGLVGAPEACGRAWIAAGLPAVLARRDLSQPERPAAPRPLGDRLAVIAAALRAQV
jgi:phytoene synthase